MWHSVYFDKGRVFSFLSYADYKLKWCIGPPMIPLRKKGRQMHPFSETFS